MKATRRCISSISSLILGLSASSLALAGMSSREKSVGSGLSLAQSECSPNQEGCYPEPTHPPTHRPPPEEEKNVLKLRFEPLFSLNFDYGQYIVNLTPQPELPRPEGKGMMPFLPNQAHESLTYGDYRDGFQKTVYGNIQAGLGAQLRFWFSNATSWRPGFWAFVGILPMAGKETESTRFVSTLEKASVMSGRYKVPDFAKDLEIWDPGDSITYIGKGGVVFGGAAGIGPIGVGGAQLAQGLWEIYVEKVGSHRVYVKLTNSRLQALSVFGMAAILTISMDHFHSADDGFSFLYDLNTDMGRKAYEDVIRGNVYSSGVLAAQKPENQVLMAPVQKIETFRSVSTGSIASEVLKIPILWNKTYSRGRIHSFTSSDLHLNRNTTRVHYGIFSSSEDSQFWRTHKEKDLMFYGAKYSVDNWENHTHMDSMFGTYSYAFRHEDSSDERLRYGIEGLIKKTGLEGLRYMVPAAADLGYTGVEFNLKFSEENTIRLMGAVQNLDEIKFSQRSLQNIQQAYESQTDFNRYCSYLIEEKTQEGIQPELSDSQCLNEVGQRTSVMMKKMFKSLHKMRATVNVDPRAFSAAYGEFGEAMAENAFTFKAAVDIAGPGVVIDYLIEGTRISMLYRKWQTDSQGRWVPVFPANQNGHPFEPIIRHSKARGVVVGTDPWQGRENQSPRH
jgi:hypothetical protein